GRECVDPHDPGVRHRTQEQLGEEHPVDAIVLRIFRLPRHLGDEVRGRVVVANELVRLVLRHAHTPAYARRAAKLSTLKGSNYTFPRIPTRSRDCSATLSRSPCHSSCWCRATLSGSPRGRNQKRLEDTPIPHGFQRSSG